MTAVPKGVTHTLRVRVLHVRWSGKYGDWSRTARVRILANYRGPMPRWTVGKLRFLYPPCAGPASPVVPGADLVLYRTGPAGDMTTIAEWTEHSRAARFDPRVR